MKEGGHVHGHKLKVQIKVKVEVEVVVQALKSFIHKLAIKFHLSINQCLILSQKTKNQKVTILSFVSHTHTRVQKKQHATHNEQIKQNTKKKQTKTKKIKSDGLSTHVTITIAMNDKKKEYSIDKNSDISIGQIAFQFAGDISHPMSQLFFEYANQPLKYHLKAVQFGLFLFSCFFYGKKNNKKQN